MVEITKAQEEIMQIIWGIGEGTVNDVMEKLPEPKPAYNTVSTVVRVLEKKKYIKHKAIGKTHIYFPAISKDEYINYFFKGSLESFFSNSLQQLVSFFVNQKKKVNLTELDELKKLIETEIKKQKK